MNDFTLKSIEIANEVRINSDALIKRNSGDPVIYLTENVILIPEILIAGISFLPEYIKLSVEEPYPVKIVVSEVQQKDSIPLKNKEGEMYVIQAPDFLKERYRETGNDLKITLKFINKTANRIIWQIKKVSPASLKKYRLTS